MTFAVTPTRRGAARMLTALVIATGVAAPVLAHEGEFAAGEPGRAAKPARTVTIAMREEYGRQIFEPDHLTVKRGEQIRFVLRNEGTHDHEFMLATTKQNLAHAKEMRRDPTMTHHDPNGITVAPGKTGTLLWHFTKAGTFEFACLFPGHREDGMHGTVTVTPAAQHPEKSSR